MKAEQFLVLALCYSVGIHLSKGDKGITSIFIAEATVDRISCDGIRSLISFCVSSFRVPPYQQHVPLVPELQLSCNFQLHFYSLCFEAIESQGVMEGLYSVCLCHHFPVNFGISIAGEH